MTMNTIKYLTRYPLLSLAKKPKDSRTNYVGVEIEFYTTLSREKLGWLLIESNIDHRIEIKGDMSIKPEIGFQSYELAVLAPEKQIFLVIKKICKILTNVDSRVNSSCGLHIHLDMRFRNPTISYYNLVNSQHLLYAINPKSRSISDFCKKNASDKFIKSNTSRYLGINPSAYNEHGTLEVRIHSGTLNFHKINNWIRILLSIASKDKKMNKFKTLEQFKKLYNVKDRLLNYMAERIITFKGDNKDYPNITEMDLVKFSKYDDSDDYLW